MILYQQQKQNIILILPNQEKDSSLHYNGNNSFLFVNTKKVYQFKEKTSEINEYSLCLGNISNYFTIKNMKKVGLGREFFFC